MPRPILAPLQLEGELFLLTFPLIEPHGGPICSGPRTIWKRYPLVNSPLRKPPINPTDRCCRLLPARASMQIIDLERLGLVIVESRLDFIAPKTCIIA